MDADIFPDPAGRPAALALARAILPGGGLFPGADERSVVAALGLLGRSPGIVGTTGALFRMLDLAAVAYTGARFSALAPDRQEQLLQRWEQDPVLRRPLFLATFLLKTAHFDHRSVYDAAGCVYEKGGPPEPARWLRQVVAGNEIEDGLELECDAVVVGTGAGGAVVGKELAERGHAVVFLEEGELHRRDSFKGSVLEAKRRFYRAQARIAAVGNALIPTFMGRLVGGSTAINTATCFRTPDWILDEWCSKLDSDALAPERMRPHFERVEQALWVAPVKPELRGPVARLVARGCDRLGWHHAPMLRNAPECDAQGVCDFGCPSGARRSMDLSYVPSALMRGAVLHTGVRAERVLTEAGRATGIEARAVATGAVLRVRARAVVLAAGAVPTPLFLLRQGICNRSGLVGRNLSLHPATSISALFDEPVKAHEGIPQSCYCGEFHREGILLSGASAPVSLVALMIPMTGRRLAAALGQFDRVASLGVMVKDHTRGRVRLGPRGAPLVTYWLTGRETELLRRGLARAAEILVAAGAKRIYPLLGRFLVLDGAGAAQKLQRERLAPWDFVLTSFHPLGTCPMGRDPARSVVGLDHEAHELRSLFIVDGSTVPGPPAVNPQITVMAMADRAAGLIAERLG
ncbi:MAG: GMC family oxidoreductase [Deltaproteobacteria bacterium]|nr:GMC family oxidoreductase [Deltaproteobacteria bacterium]